MPIAVFYGDRYAVFVSLTGANFESLTGKTEMLAFQGYGAVLITLVND
jgi:hypothetical protein